MDFSVNTQTRFCIPTLAEMNEMHREIWRERQARQTRQLEDEDLAKEAHEDLIEQNELGVPVHRQRSIDDLLDKAERRMAGHRARLLREVRQENGRQGGKARKPDALQTLIEEIVKICPRIDCSTLLQSLGDKRGQGVITDIEDGDIEFLDTDGRTKFVKITSLKDRLYRAKKKLKS